MLSRGRRAILLWAAAALLIAAIPSSASASTASAVSTGNDYSCALSGGKVYCWGTNAQGQLGDGYVGQNGTFDSSHSESDIPSQVVGLSGVVQLSAGYDSACALTSDGTVHCWGDDGYGQLGDGKDSTSTGTPVTVKSLSGVTQVSAGEFSTCAISGGHVYCWGNNNYGELGDGTATSRIGSDTPVMVSGLAGATSVSVGGAFACAVTGGAAKCWGEDDYGELGNGQAADTTCNFGGDNCTLTPVAVSGLGSGVSGISAGTGHACAIANGHVYCWGDNENAALGDGNVAGPQVCYPPDAHNLLDPCSTTPEQVSGLSGATKVSAGYQATCATAASKALCWGRNDVGQVGDGSNSGPQLCAQSCASTPVSVASISGVTDIGTGWYSACAVTVGDVACWGGNGSGQLGINSDTGPKQCDTGPDPNNPGSDAYAPCSPSPVLVDGFGAPLPGNSGSGSGGTSSPKTSLGKLHSRGHTAYFKVKCTGGPSGSSCKLRVKITAKVKKRIVVASKKVKLSTGQTKRVSVKLNRRGRAALAKAHRLRTTVTFTIGTKKVVRHLTFKLHG